MANVFMRHGRGISMRSTRRVGAIAAAAVLLTAAGLPAAVSADPPSSTGPVEVSAAVRHDVSSPLRNLGPTAPSAATLRERPLRLIGGNGPSQPDGALLTTPGPAVATSAGLNFDGLGVCEASAGCWAPPDTNGAVGATQYVQWVNAAFAVFDKNTGAIVTGFPKAGNAVWAGFGGGCQTNNDGDPIVQYDKAANRWILTQFSVSTTPYLQCVAVSTTSDATGTYNRYAFDYGSTQFPDYPKLGVWPDAYYITFNMFTSTFVGPKICAYNRAAILAGTAATQQCVQLSSSYGALLPGDLDGTTAPPAGEPNPVLSLGSNSLNLWGFHVDWANAANTTLTGPVNLPVASFSRACNGSNCVPQPSTSQKLDSLGDRLMYRLAYRNFGDHESLVVNHSVSVGGNPGVSSVRWYELRNATGFTLAGATPVVYQQGTLSAADGIHRWMGSIAMDRSGDIAVGYSASSGSLYPSIRYTGRTPTDSLGTMATENIIQAGSGSQLQNLSRWGDYSAMTVDPVDDCTFWYTSEYLTTSGTWNWSTRITSFRFPGCGSTTTVPSAPQNLTATAGNASVGLSWQTPASNGGAAIVSYSVYRGTTSGGESTTAIATVAGTSYTDTSLTNGTTYYYTVKATNSVGTGPASNEASATPTAATTVPSAPQNLTAAPASGKKGVQLTWQTPALTGGSPITGYAVYRATTSGGETLLTTLGVVTSYKDTATSRGTIYFYKAAALNAVGTGTLSTEASATAK